MGVEWINFSMSELGNCYSGLSGKNANDFGEGNSRYIPFLNVLNNDVINPSFLDVVNVGTNEKQNKVKEGDLFFNTSSETPEEVGMCAALNDELADTYLNSFCFGFRLFSNEAVPNYLAYYFNSEFGRQNIQALAQGSTRFNLSKSSFLKMQIPLPPLPEQQAIVEVLESFDEHINNLHALIAKKHAIRTGALEDLMSRRVRVDGFSGEWETIKLGLKGSFTKGAPLSKASISREGRPLILYGELYTAYSEVTNKIINKTTFPVSDCHISRKGDVLIPSSGETAEEIATATCVMLDGVALAGDLFIFRSKSFDGRFLSYVLNHLVNYDISKIAQGSTIIHLRSNELEHLDVPLPALGEQRAIAEVLTSLDEEIEVLEAERGKWQQVRAGAMGDLLSGKVRLGG